MKIPYGRQNITDEDIAAVVRTLRSDFLTQGPAVSEFETVFAETVGSRYAIAFNNATAALHVAYSVLNKDSSKKVLSTPLTFVSSTNCVLFNQGKVDFADINAKSFNIDLDIVEEKLRSNPNDYQGLVVVDFAGLPVNMEKLKTITEKYGLWTIEDGCHAIGGSFEDSKKKTIKCGSGVYNEITCFSFHPVKHIATGEGGMLTTNSEKIYRQLLKLRSHGMERDPASFVEPSHGGWYHEMQELGYNYRMSDINASLGSSQIKRLSSNIQNRGLVARRYKDGLHGLPLTFQEYEESKNKNAYHLFVIQTERRKELYDFLKTKEIYTQVHYLPVYWHPYYQSLGFKKGLCPVAENYYQKCLSLPMYHSISEEEQSYVIEKVHEFFK